MTQAHGTPSAARASVHPSCAWHVYRPSSVTSKSLVTTPNRRCGYGHTARPYIYSTPHRHRGVVW
jgi:hypothetical protein